MASRKIYIQNKPYYYFDTYSTYQQALTIAKRYHKKNKKNKYFILTTGSDIILPKKHYHLYMTKVMRLFG